MFKKIKKFGSFMPPGPSFFLFLGPALRNPRLVRLHYRKSEREIEVKNLRKKVNLS